jgi:hypothetical protein
MTLKMTQYSRRMKPSRDATTAPGIGRGVESEIITSQWLLQPWIESVNRDSVTESFSVNME